MVQRQPVPNGSPESWNVSQPSRGLGDVVAKVTHATGIDKVVKKVTKGGCGCAKRQQKLNELLPFGSGEKNDLHSSTESDD